MQVDSIIFDIDGVMVDVSDSYRRAIADTIESLSGEEFPPERIQLLKNAGGFNDDWELTDAGILCTLAKRHGKFGNKCHFWLSGGLINQFWSQVLLAS